MIDIPKDVMRESRKALLSLTGNCADYDATVIARAIMAECERVEAQRTDLAKVLREITDQSEHTMLGVRLGLNTKQATANLMALVVSARALLSKLEGKL